MYSYLVSHPAVCVLDSATPAGRTFTRGVYDAPSSALSLTGTMTLDGENIADAIFVLRTSFSLDIAVTAPTLTQSFTASALINLTPELTFNANGGAYLFLVDATLYANWVAVVVPTAGATGAPGTTGTPEKNLEPVTIAGYTSFFNARSLKTSTVKIGGIKELRNTTIQILKS